MRGLLIILALTLPTLALAAADDDPFGDDEAFDDSLPSRSTKEAERAAAEKAAAEKAAAERAAAERAAAEQAAAQQAAADRAAAEQAAAEKAAADRAAAESAAAEQAAAQKAAAERAAAIERKPAPSRDEARSSGDAPRQLQALPPAAVRGPIGILVSPRDPAANEAALAFERQLSASMATDGRLSPVDLTKQLGGLADPDIPPAAQEHLDAGKLAYDNLDLDAAANEILLALKLMLERPENVVPERVAHAFTFAGAAYQLNGDASRAADAFKHAALIAPGFSPSPSEFSPDIIEAFQTARGEANSGPKGTLTITSDVAPAVVYVGGREAGVAPLNLKGLPVGRHHVLVTCRAFKPWASFVEVTEDGSATVSAQLAALATAAPLGRAVEVALTELPSGNAGLGARDIGKLLEAGSLVLATARSDAAGSTVEYYAFDLATGRLALHGTKSIVPDAPSFIADMEALAPQIATALLEPPAIARTEKEEPSVPLTERWWFWPAVGGAGAVVVGGVVAAIIATQEPASAPTLVVTGVP